MMEIIIKSLRNKFNYDFYLMIFGPEQFVLHKRIMDDATIRHFICTDCCAFSINHFIRNVNVC